MAVLVVAPGVTVKVRYVVGINSSNKAEVCAPWGEASVQIQVRETRPLATAYKYWHRHTTDSRLLGQETSELQSHI